MNGAFPGPSAPSQRGAEGGSRLRGFRKESRADLPLISVVTVVYNGASRLADAIESVVCQAYGNVEYIVVDGGSTDGTLDVIRRYEDRIDYWVSAPDDGIYDAMNKGLSLATGALVGLLNSDDRYLPGALEAVAGAFRGRTRNEAVIAGPWRVLLDETDRGVTVTPSLKFRNLRICHQAMFVSREAYSAAGRYDTAYRYSADLDMAIRLHRSGAEFIFVGTPLACYRAFGASGRNLRSTGREQAEIIRKHLPRKEYLLFRVFRLKAEFLFTGYGIVRGLFGETAAARLAAIYFGWKGAGAAATRPPPDAPVR